MNSQGFARFLLLIAVLSLLISPISADDPIPPSQRGKTAADVKRVIALNKEIESLLNHAVLNKRRFNNRTGIMECGEIAMVHTQIYAKLSLAAHVPLRALDVDQASDRG